MSRVTDILEQRKANQASNAGASSYSKLLQDASKIRASDIESQTQVKRMLAGSEELGDAASIPSAHLESFKQRFLEQPAPGVFLGEYFAHTLPMATRWILILMFTLNLFNVAYQALDYFAVCVSPELVFHYFQVHRLLTAMFFHGSLFDLTLHMLVFANLAGYYERQIGTVHFLQMFLFLVLSSTVLRITVGWLISTRAIMPQGYWLPEEFIHCTFGMSGAVFGLAVHYAVDDQPPVTEAHAFHTTLGHGTDIGFGRRFALLFSYPASGFNWALLLFVFLNLPGNILSYLSGLAAGYYFIKGGVKSWYYVHPDTVLRIEDHVSQTRLSAHDVFKPSPNTAASRVAAITETLSENLTITPLSDMYINTYLGKDEKSLRVLKDEVPLNNIFGKLAQESNPSSQ